LAPEDLAAALAPYSASAPVLWVQEEPANMGGWTHMVVNFSEVLSRSTPVRCISRPASASPATGSSNSHKIEQDLILSAAIPATVQ
jgi:2-oxoglutarate dehydrogenase E1 component